MNWDWRRVGVHKSQSLIEWYVEQIAVVIILAIGRRAHKRGDVVTRDRMLRVSKAGALDEGV